MSISKKHIYFVGIGGIGMSALARYFVATGNTVAGYDKTPSDITRALQDLGVSIHFEDSISNIPNAFKDSDKTLVVYTPAIPRSHSQLNYFIAQNFEIKKRSQVLGTITQNTFCFAIAGTHGKTTTTSILGHLLKECNVKMTAFLGGVSENYNSNLIQNGTEITAVEADEFDRSFLTLSPDYACITSMDADHLDIYGDASELIKSFQDFSKKIKPGGKLFVRQGLPLKGITYAIEEDADYTTENIQINNGSYTFNIKTPDGILKGFTFHLPGRHNLSNALVALAMCLSYGLPHSKLVAALKTYKGVKRRFTYQIKEKDLVFIDDYAHHPKELNAVHQAVREMYPTDRVLAVFQPHLFTRTKDFADEFAFELSQFDEVLLLDIYPAREEPIKGITSQLLLDKITAASKKLTTKANLVSDIKKSTAKIILTIGAGDIGEEVKTIKKALSIAS